MKLIDQPIHKGLGLSILKSNFYGVEIELEGYRGQDNWRWPIGEDVQKVWNLTIDDSLRNGVELLSNRVTQVTLKKSWSGLQKAINNNKLKTSKRCGVHVHVNMLNLTWGQMYSFIALFALLEPYLFKKYAPERHENHFCVPLYWSTKLTNDLASDISVLRIMDVSSVPKPRKRPRSIRHTTTTSALESTFIEFVETSPSMYGNKRQFPLRRILNTPGKYKYSSMTAFRLPDLGTLEFRFFPGTANVDDVAEWVAVLGRMKKIAADHPEPLDIQRKYEDYGIGWFWRRLKVGSIPYVTIRDREDAEEGAFKIIGSKPKSVEELDWSM